MVILMTDKELKCPKCKQTWTGECFTTRLESDVGEMKPKCGHCGHVF